jgi:hypothetical protein
VYFPDLAPRSRDFLAASPKRYPAAVGVVAAALAASAIVNYILAKRAERRNLPTGRFITVEGVRLHYVERGSGPPLVLLHGNGSMIQDFQSSGLIDLAAKSTELLPSIVLDLATARGLATPFGHQKRRPGLSVRR